MLGLKKLIRLSMAHNRLENLPEGNWQQCLEEANFAHNRLMPESPTVSSLLLRLKSMDLTGNTKEREKLVRAKTITLNGHGQA